MAKLALYILLFFFPLPSFAQGTIASPARVPQGAPVIPVSQAKTTESIARFVNSHYKTPQEKVKAIYQWLAANISYDVLALTNMPRYYEKEALITQTLSTKRALCQGYAEVFSDLCAKTGIQAHLITGFVIQRGTSTPMTHAWCAAQIGGQWYLFDPTWGAGYVDNGIFVSRINDRYFMVAPAKMIQTHIPFDPLFQFLTQPLTYQEFLSPKAVTPSRKPVFYFRDSLAVYQASTSKAQLEGTIRRISENKVIPPVALEQLNHVKKNLAVVHHNQTVDLYNQAVNSFNAAIDRLNQFTRYRNNRFQPAKSDQELKKMPQKCTEKLLEAKQFLQQIKPEDNTSLFLSLQNMKAVVEKALLQAEKQEAFVARYLNTPVKQRNALFYKQALADTN